MQLVELLEKQTLDDSTSPRFAALHSAWPRWEGTLTALFRARSNRSVPLIVAALSVRFLSYKIPRQVWESISFFTRLVMSPVWTQEICTLAVQHDPGAPYATADGLSAACFDNFTMQVGYGSYATVDSSGYRLDMTNWASLSLPAAAIPAGLNIPQLLAHGGLFRSDLTLADFQDLFSPRRPAILSNRIYRWRIFLAAAANGTLLDKPSYTSPYPPTHLNYHEPMFLIACSRRMLMSTSRSITCATISLTNIQMDSSGVPR